MNPRLQFQCGNLCIGTIRYDSASELSARAEEAGQFFVVGDSSSAKESYLLRARNTSSKLESHCALFVSEPSIEPQLFFLDNNANECLLGFDEEVNRVSFLDLRCLERIQLLGHFYCFVAPPNLPTVLAIYELGVVAISRVGGVAWKCSTGDVVTEYDIGNEQIILTCADGTQTVHDMMQP